MSPEAVRELLFLDFALEQQQTLPLQGDHCDFSLAQMCMQLREMAQSLAGHHETNGELAALCYDWMAFTDDCVNNKFSSPVECALMLKVGVVGLALCVWTSIYAFYCKVSLAFSLF